MTLSFEFWCHRVRLVMLMCSVTLMGRIRRRPRCDNQSHKRLQATDGFVRVARGVPLVMLWRVAEAEESSLDGSALKNRQNKHNLGFWHRF